jgi:hypothetical protein
MYNSEFEKQVQEKMEEFRLSPSDNLWDRIETALPAKPRKRRYILLLALLLLTGSGIVWLNRGGNRPVNNTAVSTTDKKTVADGITQNNTIYNTSNTGTTPGSTKTYSPTADTAKDATLQNQPVVMQQQSVVPPAVTSPGNANNDIADNSRIKNHIVNSKEVNNSIASKQNHKRTTKILLSVNSAVIQGDGDKKSVISNAKTGRKKAGRANITITQQNDVVANEPIAGMQSAAAEKLPINIAEMNRNLWPQKKITVDSTVVSNTAKADAKSGKRNWQYGLTLSGGLGKQAENPLGFITGAGNLFVQGLGGNPSTADSFYTSVKKSRSSKAFSAGVYMQRQVNKRWNIQLGLSYAYQSHITTTGVRVDSVASYFINGVSLETQNYFQLAYTNRFSGTGFTQDYINRVHILQVPFEAQYSLGRKRSWNLLGGISAGYLLSSNALVFRGSPPSYLYSNNAYNRLLFSLHSGISYHNSKGYPFSTGVRMGYGINSFIKKEVNNQHLVSTQLFFNIPFKK